MSTKLSPNSGINIKESLGTPLSNPGLEDIPIAQRDTPPPSPGASSPSKPWLIGVGAGTIVLLLLALGISLFSDLSATSGARSANSPVNSGPLTAAGGSPDSNLADEPGANPDQDILLGHRKYEEAPAAILVPISGDQSLLLREAAADAWFRLEAAARDAGIHLVPLSAFRSQEMQQYLFFDIKAQRGQDAPKRAEVSAPPGYSEHHTGYALDIGDADYPGSDLSESFETTPAFEWLQDNAAYYGFELSFPRDNEQGISYEPWHWRYVGDQDSLETFYRE